jgi:hypothetical protein
MLSRHRHPSPEEPPRRREPQPPPAELFATLGEHPHDPLSILPFSPAAELFSTFLQVSMNFGILNYFLGIK